MHYEVREIMVIDLPILNKIRICNWWREAVYLNPTRLPSWSKIIFQVNFRIILSPRLQIHIYSHSIWSSTYPTFLCRCLLQALLPSILTATVATAISNVRTDVFQPFLFILYGSTSAEKLSMTDNRRWLQWWPGIQQRRQNVHRVLQ